MMVARLPAYHRRTQVRRRRARSSARAGTIWSRHPEYVAILLLAGCALMGLALVALPANTMAASYEMASLRARLSLLQQEVSGLEMQLAALESLERIDRIAREQLGMREPAQVRLLPVEEARPLVLAGPDLWQPEDAGPWETLASRVRALIARAVVGRPVQAGPGR
ncbi:MAG TPA: hypothetical protein DCM14_09365 [Clostridiales bacterium UBA8153]|nr:hypothetical protein [Clostridiales bacterium UBA8153]